MHKFKSRAIALAVSRSFSHVETAGNIAKDDDLGGKEPIAIKYTLTKTGVYRKLHRI